MGPLRSKLKHAFAVDAPGAVEPTKLQRPAVEWICTQIAKRHLSTPGLIFFEMTRPLNYLGAQVMHLTSPGVWAIAPKHIYGGYIHFAEFLERRGSMEYMCWRIEELEAEYSQQEHKQEAERTKNKKNKKSNPQHHDED
ncbi:MAG: hypothetical protein IIC46_08700 [Planctomycetes bacterium]|nr:hypothetical protein [Planctomycetota bacterium]